MEERQLRDNFYKNIRQFCKDNGIKMNDPKFVAIYKDMFANLMPCIYEPKLPDLKDLPKSIVDLYESFVQQSIDVIRNNPEIRAELEIGVQRLKESWNLPDDNVILIPDVRIYFGADCLLESVEAGKHVPDTDASLGLYVGNKPVYSIM